MATGELIDDASFVHVKTRAELSRVLTREQYISMLEADTIDAIDPAIAAAAGLPPDTGPDMPRLEVRLREQLIATVARLAKTAPAPIQAAIIAYVERYQVENLKMLFIGKLARASDASISERVMVPVATLTGTTSITREAIRASSIDEVVLLFRHTPYRAILREVARRYRATGEVFYIHALLDRFFVQLYDTRATAHGKLNDGDARVMNHMASILADQYNISMAIRGYNNGFHWDEVEVLLVQGNGKITTSDVLELFTMAGDPATLQAALRRLAARYRDGDRLARLITSTRPVHSVNTFFFNTALSLFKRARRETGSTLADIMTLILMKEAQIENLITIIEGVKNDYDRSELASYLTLEG